MSKQKKKKENDVLYKEAATYATIYQNRPAYYRVAETVVFANVLFLISAFMPVEGWARMAILVFILICFIAGVPYLYKIWLSPTYTLTNDALIVKMRNKERKFPLSEVERASNWKPSFRLSGKKVNLMVSRNFVDRLEEQISRSRKKRKR